MDKPITALRAHVLEELKHMSVFFVVVFVGNDYIQKNVSIGSVYVLRPQNPRVIYNVVHLCQFGSR